MSREEGIRERLEAATPGPWEWGAESSDWGDGGPDLETVAKQPPHRDGSVSPEHRVVGAWGHDAWGIDVEQADADLIANAPADLAYLLAENARLRAQLDTVRELADKYKAARSNPYYTPIPVWSEIEGDIRAVLNQGGETNGE